MTTPGPGGRVVIDCDNRVELPFKLLGDTHAGWQTGSLWATPNVRRVLPFEFKAGDPANAEAAIYVLDNAIRTELDLGHPVDVYGHSYAAEVIDKYLRSPVSAGLPTNAAQLRFLKAANPGNRYTGIAVRQPGFDLYGGVGFPLGCPYAVREMTLRYDITGDFPSDPNSVHAKAQIGLYIPGIGIGFSSLAPAMLYAHIRYTDVPFFDPGGPNSGYVTYAHPDRPHHHFTWARTFPLPSLRAAAGWRSRNRTRQLDRDRRAATDQAYALPPGVTIPAPTY